MGVEAIGGWDWLMPVIAAGLMGITILVYVCLDGFDLGIGLLSPRADRADRDRMVASIGPFWDANETWLVLAVGLLLTAFPIAHGTILTAFYLPVLVLLIGVILRGVAFEFRAKAPEGVRHHWDRAFFGGSLMMSLSQGWMLGVYVLGLSDGWYAWAFGALTALCLSAAYVYIGAAWLILKTDGALQERAVGWAKTSLAGTAVGMVAISAASPLASERIFDRWFGFPEVLLLAPFPLTGAVIFLMIWRTLGRLPHEGDRHAWVPFVGGTALFVLGFAGLAYSFYPYVVPERLTIWQAATSTQSLAIILVGTAFVLPVIGGYTIFAYRVFGGKATALSYD